MVAGCVPSDICHQRWADEVAKKKLIEGATAILDRRPSGTSVAPVYVVIHEIEETNWGIFGPAGRSGSAPAPAMTMLRRFE